MNQQVKVIKFPALLENIKPKQSKQPSPKDQREISTAMHFQQEKQYQQTFKSNNTLQSFQIQKNIKSTIKIHNRSLSPTSFKSHIIRSHSSQRSIIQTSQVNQDAISYNNFIAKLLDQLENHQLNQIKQGKCNQVYRNMTKYTIKTSAQHSNVLNLHIINWEQQIFIANLNTNLKSSLSEKDLKQADKLFQEGINVKQELQDHINFDEKFSFQEIVKIQQQSVDPLSMVLNFYQNKYKWYKAKILNYNEDKKLFEVDILELKLLKSVQRYSIIFWYEDVNKHLKKIQNAQSIQMIQKLNQQYYIEFQSVPDSFISEFPILLKQKIIQNHIKSNQKKHKLQSSKVLKIWNDYAYQIFGEIESNYKEIMKEFYLLNDINKNENQRYFKHSNINHNTLNQPTGHAKQLTLTQHHYYDKVKTILNQLMSFKFLFLDYKHQILQILVNFDVKSFFQKQFVNQLIGEYTIKEYKSSILEIMNENQKKYIFILRHNIQKYHDQYFGKAICKFHYNNIYKFSQIIISEYFNFYILQESLNFLEQLIQVDSNSKIKVYMSAHYNKQTKKNEIIFNPDFNELKQTYKELIDQLLQAIYNSLKSLLQDYNDIEPIQNLLDDNRKLMNEIGNNSLSRIFHYIDQFLVEPFKLYLVRYQNILDVLHLFLQIKNPIDLFKQSIKKDDYYNQIENLQTMLTPFLESVQQQAIIQDQMTFIIDQSLFLNLQVISCDFKVFVYSQIEKQSNKLYTLINKQFIAYFKFFQDQFVSFYQQLRTKPKSIEELQKLVQFQQQYLKFEQQALQGLSSLRVLFDEFFDKRFVNMNNDQELSFDFLIFLYEYPVQIKNLQECYKLSCDQIQMKKKEFEIVIYNRIDNLQKNYENQKEIWKQTLTWKDINQCSQYYHQLETILYQGEQLEAEILNLFQIIELLYYNEDTENTHKISLQSQLDKIQTNYKQNFIRLQLVKDTWNAIYNYQSEKQKFMENSIINIELQSLNQFIHSNQKGLKKMIEKCIFCQLSDQIDLMNQLQTDLDKIKMKEEIFTIFLSTYVISRRDRLENLLRICNISISFNEINLNNILQIKIDQETLLNLKIKHNQIKEEIVIEKKLTKIQNSLKSITFSFIEFRLNADLLLKNIQQFSKKLQRVQGKIINEQLITVYIDVQYKVTKLKQNLKLLVNIQQFFTSYQDIINYINEDSSSGYRYHFDNCKQLSQEITNLWLTKCQALSQTTLNYYGKVKTDNEISRIEQCREQLLNELSRSFFQLKLKVDWIIFLKESEIIKLLQMKNIVEIVKGFYKKYYPQITNLQIEIKNDKIEIGNIECQNSTIGLKIQIKNDSTNSLQILTQIQKQIVIQTQQLLRSAFNQTMLVLINNNEFPHSIIIISNLIFLTQRLKKHVNQKSLTEFKFQLNQDISNLQKSNNLILQEYLVMIYNNYLEIIANLLKLTNFTEDSYEYKKIIKYEYTNNDEPQYSIGLFDKIILSDFFISQLFKISIFDPNHDNLILQIYVAINNKQKLLVDDFLNENKHYTFQNLMQLAMKNYIKINSQAKRFSNQIIGIFKLGIQGYFHDISIFDDKVSVFLIENFIAFLIINEYSL